MASSEAARSWPPGAHSGLPRLQAPRPWLRFRLACLSRCAGLGGRRFPLPLCRRGAPVATVPCHQLRAVLGQLIADSPGMGLAKSRAASPAKRELASKREIRCLVDLNPLPDELLVLVLSWVSGRSLVTRCRLVCRRWRDLIDSPTLWTLKWEREPSKRGLLEEARKVARRTPQIEWSRLGVLEPFGRNLIKNPCGTEQLMYWKMPCRLGQSRAEWSMDWTVEESRDFVEGAEAQTCFVSSYQNCIKWQVVDLLEEGLWEDLLDTCQPDIVVSDWWGGREDCGCRYAISVRLLAAKRRLVLAEFSSQPDHIPQWNDAKYQQVSHVFQNYGPGVRHVCFQHEGQDTQHWAGHYGARVTNSTVLVKMP